MSNSDGTENGVKIEGEFHEWGVVIYLTYYSQVYLKPESCILSRLTVSIEATVSEVFDSIDISI